MSDQPAPSPNNFFQKIRIQNLLSFGPDSPEIELKPLNIIIGENGVGKSNLLTVFEFIGLLPNYNDGSYFRKVIGSAKNFIWKGPNPQSRTRELAFQVSNGPESYNFLINKYKLGYDETNDRLLFLEEEIERGVESSDPSIISQPVFLNHASKESFWSYYHTDAYIVEKNQFQGMEIQKEELKDSSFSKASTSLSQIAEKRFPYLFYMRDALSNYKLVVHKETDFGPSSVLRQAQEYRDYKPIYPDFSNLFHHLLVHFRENLNYKREFMGYLQRFNPRIKDLSVNGLDTSRIKLFAEEEGLNSLIPVENISDGTLHFICLLAILLNPNPPKLVCIEEPENGLHPDAIHLVAELLKEASKRMQIIVTTHSAHLISYFSDMPEAIMVAEKDERGTVFHRLTERQKKMIGDVGIGTIWLQGKIGGVK